MGGTFGRVPDVGLLKSVQVKASQMGGDWGRLTAAFTGFTSASTVIRGRCVERHRRLKHATYRYLFIIVATLQAYDRLGLQSMIQA